MIIMLCPSTSILSLMKVEHISIHIMVIFKMHFMLEHIIHEN